MASDRAPSLSGLRQQILGESMCQQSAIAKQLANVISAANAMLMHTDLVHEYQQRTTAPSSHHSTATPNDLFEIIVRSPTYPDQNDYKAMLLHKKGDGRILYNSQLSC